MPVGCRWTSPSGGFYVWLGLPPGVDAKAMLPRAIAARVAYVPGTGFYAGGQGGDHLRLSYCFPEPSRIREGVRRLAEVIAAEVELRSTFGSPASLDSSASSVTSASFVTSASSASPDAQANPAAAAADPVQ
jgi:hypothetical protein